MKNFFLQLKSNIGKIALTGIIFVALFFLGFYVVNLDLNPAKKIVEQTDQTSTLALDSQVKEKMGTTEFSMETYADWTKRKGLANTNNALDADPDKDGLPNYGEYVYGTNPLKADTDGDGFSDKQEIANGYDPDAPGDTKPSVEISIAKINVDAPMVWSTTDQEADMLKDLENGLSHFSKTAAPGQNGNMIVSGHSSNYFWAKGDYNHIFKDLNNLEKGDIVKVKTTQQNGRVITYSYQVTDKFITVAEDPKIFSDTQNSTLTLSTCWPIGTNLKRVIVKAQVLQ